jgi:beta-glucosidase/6-phospho-beta-glucosidase/beta-galactosidase
MGVKYYSISIAWTRILPFALPGTPVIKAGIDHYNDLINFIIEKGMVPEVTLIHFDTPIQFYGNNLLSAAAPPEIAYVNGAYQNETFPDAFVNYAKIAMTHFSDRVSTWYTFNEPFLHSYNCKSVYHVIKAHARVYHFYKEELQGKGKISIKFNNNFGVPRDPKSKADVYAADHFNSFQLGPLCNPIFLGQDYPD